MSSGRQNLLSADEHEEVSVDSHINPRRQDANCKGVVLKVVYLQCYFVTIATILGTGILGLPVTLTKSGLHPFLITFLGGYIVQALLIYFFTDLLQRAYAAQVFNAKTGAPENVPLNDIPEESELDDVEAEHELSGAVLAGHVIIPKESIVRAPNLHLLGTLFLPCGLRQLFDLVLLVQFIALLVSYALAGSEAYAEIIQVDHEYVIPVFVWLLAFAIVFALKCIQPVVSILTFAKGSLLVATVAVTFLVGSEIHHDIHNDFSNTGQPFLMGTVALGGVINVMPFLYGKIAPVASQVRGFRLAIILGLSTCTILNVLWCWAVLDIVPQRNSCFEYTFHENNTFHKGFAGTSPQIKLVCAHNLSLETAAQNGEISTIPLTQLIHHVYPTYDWVAFLVELFIMISITVSFLTIGAAMHHTLCGWVESFFHQERVSTYSQRLKKIESWSCKCITLQGLCKSAVSLFAFTCVFAIAMINPKGFEVMLEKGSSFFINLEAGVFVFIMLLKSQTQCNRNLRIPQPMRPCVYYLQYILPFYFCFAIAYDVYMTTLDIVYNKQAWVWLDDFMANRNPAWKYQNTTTASPETLLTTVHQLNK